ncbi:hypothetical protein Syn6312_1367 [Synechococcus sp. PCC 6312]|nr:hypothetical protein Syn6312_1367 [Synechococcus sp. PCC 6312]
MPVYCYLPNKKVYINLSNVNTIEASQGYLVIRFNTQTGLGVTDETDIKILLAVLENSELFREL